MVGTPTGGPIRVVEVRRYDGLVEVIYLEAEGTRRKHDPQSWRPPKLTDDVGTEYAFVGGGGGMSGTSAEFQPGVPAGARRLRIVIDGRVAEVKLR